MEGDEQHEETTVLTSEGTSPLDSTTSTTKQTKPLQSSQPKAKAKAKFLRPFQKAKPTKSKSISQVIKVPTLNGTELIFNESIDSKVKIPVPPHTIPIGYTNPENIIKNLQQEYEILEELKQKINTELANIQEEANLIRKRKDINNSIDLNQCYKREKTS